MWLGDCRANLKRRTLWLSTCFSASASLTFLRGSSATSGPTADDGTDDDGTDDDGDEEDRASALRGGVHGGRGPDGGATATGAVAAAATAAAATALTAAAAAAAVGAWACLFSRSCSRQPGLLVAVGTGAGCWKRSPRLPCKQKPVVNAACSWSERVRAPARGYT